LKKSIEVTNMQDKNKGKEGAESTEVGRDVKLGENPYLEGAI